MTKTPRYAGGGYRRRDAIEDNTLARAESHLTSVQRRDGHPVMNGPAKPVGWLSVYHNTDERKLS